MQTGYGLRLNSIDVMRFIAGIIKHFQFEYDSNGILLLFL